MGFFGKKKSTKDKIKLSKGARKSSNETAAVAKAELDVDRVSTPEPEPPVKPSAPPTAPSKEDLTEESAPPALKEIQEEPLMREPTEDTEEEPMATQESKTHSEYDRGESNTSESYDDGEASVDDEQNARVATDMDDSKPPQATQDTSKDTEQVKETSTEEMTDFIESQKVKDPATGMLCGCLY